MIKIKSSHLETIKNQGIIHYPEECCGLLIGKSQGKENTVIKIVPTVNDWHNQKYLFREIIHRPDFGTQENFAIAPQSLLQIQKKARQQNLDIIGVYHSHPDHPSIPSEFDRAIAWNGYSYIIVSITKNQVKSLSSWRLNNLNQFLEEKMVVS